MDYTPSGVEYHGIEQGKEIVTARRDAVEEHDILVWMHVQMNSIIRLLCIRSKTSTREEIHVIACG